MERGTKTSYLLLLSYIIYSVANYYLVQTLTESTSLVAFQFLGIGIFLAFLVSLLVNIIRHIRSGKPKDVWKLGWIGAIGILGFIPGFGTGFFGLYGFFGFFGFKKK